MQQPTLSTDAHSLDTRDAAPALPGVGTHVCTPDGKEGVVVNHASCGFRRVEVAYLNRARWQVQRRWYDAGALTVEA